VPETRAYVNVSPASGSVGESTPAGEPIGAFSATLAGVNTRSVGDSLAFVTARVKAAVTGVLPAT
jgi:hypothetical protein